MTAPRTPDWLTSCDLFDEPLHPHPLNDETDPSALDGCEKIASSIIEPRQLPQIDFDLSFRAQRGTPGVFRFGDPRAIEPARKFQPAYFPVFVNRDS